MAVGQQQPGRWVDLIAADQIEPGNARTVVVGDHAYAVCNDDGRFAVVDNTCPHAGGNLGEGIVAAGRIICPWHYFEWDLDTGQATDPWPRRLRVYLSKVQTGRVLAFLDAPAISPP